MQQKNRDIEIKMQFNQAVAEDVGVEEAIMLSNMKFWCEYHRVQKTEGHFHDEKWWTYNSIEAFTELFTFWSGAQVIRILRNLVNAGYLVETDSLNELRFDRTKWYAICLNKQQEQTEQATGANQTGITIPDSKPNRSYDAKVLADSKYDGKLIPELINEFRHVNPMYHQFFSRPPQRNAIIALLDAKGEEELRKILAVLPITNVMPYSPIINSPIDLMNKLGKLYAFMQKEQAMIASKGIKITL